MFDTTATAVLGVVIRVAVVYLALLFLLRVSGRRTMSDVTPMDIMMMLLVSETVSPALTGNDDSLVVGLVAATTLIAIASAISLLVFHSRRAEVVISGRTAVLIKDGHVDSAVLRRYRITDEDLETSLHQNGLMAVSEVRRAFVEPDGEITVVKAKPEA
ncbi:MAG TPA: YetF domain-containing protein [Kofleriaceae bacterium]|nr:YetF domain-containing protein [Kofleriaceae bacterium]